MAMIALQDLELDSCLDRRAMAIHFGGTIIDRGMHSRVQIGTPYHARKEGLGTFLVNGELMHRYHDVKLEVYEVRYEYDQSFIGAISTWPLAGTP